MPSSPDRTSFTLGRVNVSPSDTQGGSRVPELGSLGSVRGALSNERPYRDLLLRPQHHWARPAGRVRELEFSVEALLALEPSRGVRSLLRRPRGDEPDGPLGSDARLHRRAGARLGRRRQRGAGWSSAGPLARRFLDQDPPQG